MQARDNANNTIKLRVFKFFCWCGWHPEHCVVAWQWMLALLDCGTRCRKYGAYFDTSDLWTWLYLTQVFSLKKKINTSFLLELYASIACSLPCLTLLLDSGRGNPC